MTAPAPRRHPVLDRLRRAGGPRPLVDPGLSGGLREWLEDGVAGAAAALPPGSPPLILDRWALADPASVTSGHGADAGAVPRAPRGADVTPARAEAALVGALFRHLLVAGETRDPAGDALAALALDGHAGPVVEFVGRLAAPERAALWRAVAAHAAVMAPAWSAVPAGWLPRTGDHLRVPLAGGRIVLVGTADLLLGAPDGARAGVCAVDVRSGPARPAHRDDLHLLGLLETVRSGAPPFRLATYYTGSGHLEVEDVSDALLAGAVARTLRGVDARCRELAAIGTGTEPAPPAPLPATGGAQGDRGTGAAGAAAARQAA